MARLNTTQYGRAAALKPVGMRFLANQILITTLAVCHQGNQVALRPRRHKQPCLEAQQAGGTSLQKIDGRITPLVVIAQFRGMHGCLHALARTCDSIASQVDFFFITRATRLGSWPAWQPEPTLRFPKQCIA